jgi:REP-associated tyrosine transposase
MDIQDKDDAWSITYHFVWQPMRSKACLTDEVARRLRALVEEQAGLLEFHPRALIILPDRVYLAAEAPPTLAPHSIVCRVKSLTSRALRHEFPELTRIPTLWTRQYLVLAGDEMTPEEVLTRFQSLLRPRRPRGRPRKNTSESQSPDVHSDDG